MEMSPFARLSAELRNKIYTYALYNTDGVWLEHPTDDLELKPGWKLRLHAFGNPTALAMTCRQIHAESGLLFYSINKFFIQLERLQIRNRFGDWIWYPWDEEVETWLNTVGSPNASCVARLCLHLGQYRSNEEADDILDKVDYLKLPKLWARAWSDNLAPSLSFGSEFLNLESPNSPGDRWVESLFELPLCDKSEAKRQVDLIFDQKLAALSAHLKQVEEEGEQEQRAPWLLEFPCQERSIRGVTANIDDLKHWRGRIKAVIRDDFRGWTEESDV